MSKAHTSEDALWRRYKYNDGHATLSRSIMAVTIMNGAPLRRILLSIALFMTLAISYVRAAEPLFRSGFDPGTRVESVGQSGLCLMGTDTVTGANWSMLGKSDSAIPPLHDNAYINTADKSPEHAGAEIVTTFPATDTNPALRLRVLDDDPVSKWVTRSCVRLDYRYGTQAVPEYAFRKCCIRFRMFLAPAYVQHLGTARDEWFQLFEIWDCGRQWNRPEMSINVKVQKSGSECHLEFNKRIKGTDEKFTVLNREQNPSFSLPFGRWVDVECSYNAGFGSESGRFVWRMDDTTVFDLAEGDAIGANPLVLHENRPIMNIQPMKIYQADALIDRMREAGMPCEAWYDDFEYWGEVPGAMTHLHGSATREGAQCL